MVTIIHLSAAPNRLVGVGIFLTGNFLPGQMATRASVLLGKGPRGYPHLGTQEGGQTAPGGASVHLKELVGLMLFLSAENWVMELSQKQEVMKILSILSHYSARQTTPVIMCGPP